MNNCVIQGRIEKIDTVKFYYYEKIKAELNVHLSDMDITKESNYFLCKIYEGDIDIFLDKYKLHDICVFYGSIRNVALKSVNKDVNGDEKLYKKGYNDEIKYQESLVSYILVKEVY